MKMDLLVRICDHLGEDSDFWWNKRKRLIEKIIDKHWAFEIGQFFTKLSVPILQDIALAKELPTRKHGKGLLKIELIEDISNKM